MKRKVSDLRVAELKVELEKRGLESKGLKGVLVQRLQKAIEEEGGNASEIEFSASETASPKASRRSVGRLKRTVESEEESSQEEKVETGEPDTVEVTERAEEINGSNTIDEASFHSVNPSQIEQQNVVIEEEITEEVRTQDTEEVPADDNDATPTRDEEDDEGSTYEEDTQQVCDEEVIESEEVNMEGNDFRSEHEDVGEYPEDEGQIEEEASVDVTGEGEQVVAAFRESESNVNMEETIEEPAAGSLVKNEGDIAQENLTEEVVVSEVYLPDKTIEEADVAQTETGHTLIKIDTMDNNISESTIQDVKMNVENIKDEKVIKQDLVDEKEKSETGKDEVAAEEDFLDMLDYDLEITSDQNNINPEDQQTKTSESEGTTNTGKSTNDKTMSPSQQRKTRQSSDSLKRPSADQSKSGGQSSKSSTSATKDGNKTPSSGKSGSASKKDDSTNKNLWVSGLSSTTRASELKSAFSRYGKVIGAKVVTNVKSPGSRCYGYVTMATAEAASKCILHLNNTEMHGRMITVEIAKGDPSASSKKPASSSSAKKESESKDASSKSKESDSKPGSTSTRRQSGAATSSSTKDASGDKDKIDSDKKPASSDAKSKDGSAARKSTDDIKNTRKSKSPARDRSRAERTSASGPRGEKRHNRSPPHNRNASSRSSTGASGGKDEPERKRARQPDAADRKVVIDSNKGELRVNVSRNSERAARWQGNDQKPKPLLSRRRSASPMRRRPLSPMRGSVLSRTGRGRGGRMGGRGGMLSRQSGTYEDRRGAQSRNTGRGGILSFNQIRAQQRERDRARIAERGARLGRGGASRADLHADRERLRREREERDKLRQERERLERERRQLEKDRQERERLEAERLRLEAERKRELERIEREKAEMRRLQEITRYEVEQRQRAIKRTYDDDSTSHRGNRSSNRDIYDSKRPMVSDREIGRSDSRRERDDRRGYDGYNQRGGPSRNGPLSRNDSSEPPPPGTTTYRSSQASYHGSGSGPTDSRGKSGNSAAGQYRDGRRGPDGDARYGGSTAATAGRTVEKYDRRPGSRDTAGGRSVEYAHGYDRETADSQGRRRPTAASGRDQSGRKVVRERQTGSSATSQEFRRPGARSGSGARIEITREQSPPVRRARRDSSPSGNARAPSSGSRGGAWRDTGKTTGRETSRRGVDDRDLREQIRGGRQDSYSEQSRERGSQRRGGGGSHDSSHSPSPPGRSSGQYQGRWPDSTESSSSQIYSVGSEGSSIPTTGRNTGSAAWGHVQQWPSATQNVRAWPGSSMPASATSAISRQMLAAAGYGTVAPSPTALIAPPQSMIPATQGYIPSSDTRQSRSSFPANYKPIQRRY
ncbi:uncharacterized protein LOC120337264 [Styela clava]